MPETTQFAGNGDSPEGGSLKANTVLLGRYRIQAVLGGGGMGTVYRGRDLNFPDVQKLVAVKEMLISSTDPAMRRTNLNNFKRESNILATLSHPAIPKIFEFFEQGERAYLVMEYINGSDLELLLNKTRELPAEKIVEWAIDLCDVLDYLHRNQPDPIIFRDMKPSNVMIDSLGKVRLIDFGIAKNFAPLEPGKKHTMIGTEGYSAPEQYKGEVNPISDIYSLGATLHHVLTRKDPRLEPPFSFQERSITELNPKASKALADVVMKALHFDAKERWQSCSEMKAALERVRSGATSVAVSTPSVQPATPGTAPKPSSAAQASTSSTSFFDDVDTDVSSGVEAKWIFKTEDEIRSSPTAFRNLVYVGSYDTNVWALKNDTGELAWKFATKGGIASSPVIDADSKLVVFGSEDKTLYAVDATTGRISWTYPTKDRVRGTARVAHGHVFFGSDDGYLYAVMAANGRFLWEYDLGAPVRSRPYVTNELVIVGCDSGEIVGVELSGKRKWSVRAKQNVMSSPTVDKDGFCYVGSMDGYLYVIDANTGYISWRFRSGGKIVSSPIAEDGVCYFGCTDGIFYAVNTQNSKEKWKFNAGKAIVSSPALHKGAIYFGGTDGFLYCLDANTGKERWRFETKVGITSTPYITENAILIGSLDKTLYALPLVG
jgi:eukaryotic-like serine/threonine-protein kinase